MNRKPKINNMNLTYLIDWAKHTKKRFKHNEIYELYTNELLDLLENAVDLILSLEEK